jgi:hypothetical protein
MNEFLAAAPRSEVAHGFVGCLVQLDDLADRPPRSLADNEVLDIGGRTIRRRVRHLDTPHVPHNWESRVIFEEVTETLFCGDLFTHVGGGPAVVEEDLVGRALDSEAMFRQLSSLSSTVATLRALAHLEPRTLAIMHGSSFRGDGGAALRALADGLEERFGSELDFCASQPGQAWTPLGAGTRVGHPATSAVG